MISITENNNIKIIFIEYNIFKTDFKHDFLKAILLSIVMKVDIEVRLIPLKSTIIWHYIKKILLKKRNTNKYRELYQNPYIKNLKKSDI